MYNKVGKAHNYSVKDTSRIMSINEVWTLSMLFPSKTHYSKQKGVCSMRCPSTLLLLLQHPFHLTVVSSCQNDSSELCYKIIHKYTRKRDFLTEDI